MKQPRQDTSEVGKLFSGPTTSLSSSRLRPWNGAVIEEILLDACEMPEGISDRYLLAMWRTHGTGEHASDKAGFLPFTKPVGVLTFVGPGPIPAARTASDNRLICASIDATYVNAITDEQDRQHRGPLLERTGFTDPGIARLLELLSLEASSGGESGRLYADQLTHALGTRVLMLSEDRSPKQNTSRSGLPRSALRRVLERLEAFEENVQLAALAKESGYSRRHFLRLFRQSVGMTPHHYVMQIKLRRAEKLMNDKSLSLVDIALQCGFSSHSHMTRTFREQRGVAPSELRRSLYLASGD